MFSDVFVNFVSNVDAFTDELRQVNFQLNVMASLAKNTEQSMRALVYVGFQIGRTLANMLTSAAESFIELDQGIANLSTVLTATEETYEKLTDQIMAWSNQHVTSTNEAIQATYNMASAGLSQAEVFATVDKAATLSTAAMGTMDQATQLLTDSMNSFGKSMDSTATAVEKATDFMNGYAYVVQQFKIILPELQAGMARVAGAATTVGAEFGEAAVALGALKTSGLTVSQAGTALKNFYERLGKLSNDLNINLTDNNGNLLQISEILKLVQGAYGGAVDSLSEFADLQVILGKRGSLVVTLLQNQIDSLAAHEKAVRTSADAAEMAAKREEGLAAQIQILTNSFDNFKKVMGEALLPIIAGVTDALQKITLGLQTMDDATKNNAVRIGALVAAVGVFLGLTTPLTLGLFKIASGLAAVAGAATATATAVGFATAGLFVLGGTLAATVIINSVKAAGALEQTSLKAQELANSAIESNNRLISLAETLDEITDSGRNYDTTNSELVTTIQQLIKYLPQFRSLLSLDGTQIDASIIKLREFTQEVGIIADNARKANRYRLEVEIDEASKNLERVSHDLVSLNELIVQVSEDPIIPIQFDSSTEDSFVLFSRLRDEIEQFLNLQQDLEDFPNSFYVIGQGMQFLRENMENLDDIELLKSVPAEDIEKYRSFVSVVETLGVSIENTAGEVKSYDEILAELFALQEQYTAEITNTENSLEELKNQYINTDEAAARHQETLRGQVEDELRAKESISDHTAVYDEYIKILEDTYGAQAAALPLYKELTAAKDGLIQKTQAEAEAYVDLLASIRENQEQLRNIGTLASELGLSQLDIYQQQLDKVQDSIEAIRTKAIEEGKLNSELSEELDLLLAQESALQDNIKDQESRYSQLTEILGIEDMLVERTGKDQLDALKDQLSEIDNIINALEQRALIEGGLTDDLVAQLNALRDIRKAKGEEAEAIEKYRSDTLKAQKDAEKEAEAAQKAAAKQMEQNLEEEKRSRADYVEFVEDSSDTIIDSLIGETAALRNNINNWYSLKSALSSAEYGWDKSQEALTDLRNELKEQEQEIKNYAITIANNLVKGIEQLGKTSSEISSYFPDMQRYGIDISKYNTVLEQANELQEEYAKLVNEVKKDGIISVAEVAQLHNLNDALTNANANLEQYKTELEQVALAIGKIETAQNNLEVALKLAEVEYAVTGDALDKLTATTRAYEQQLQTLMRTRAEMSDEDKLAAALDEQITTVYGKYQAALSAQNAEESRLSIIKELEQEQASLNTTLSNTNKELTAHSLKYDNINDNLNLYKNNLTTVTTAIAKLEEQLKRLEEIPESSKLVEATQAQIATLEEQRIELQKLIAEETKAALNNKFQDKLEDLSLVVSSTKDRISDFITSIRATRDYSVFDEQIDKIKAQQQIIEDSLKDQASQIDSSKKILQDYIQEIEKAGLTVDDDFVGQLNRSIAEQEKELENAKNKYVDYVNTASVELQKLEVEQKAVETAIKDSEKAAESFKDSQINYFKQLNQIDQEYKSEIINRINEEIEGTKKLEEAAEDYTQSFIRNSRATVNYYQNNIRAAEDYLEKLEEARDALEATPKNVFTSETAANIKKVNAEIATTTINLNKLNKELDQAELAAAFESVITNIAEQQTILSETAEYLGQNIDETSNDIEVLNRTSEALQTQVDLYRESINTLIATKVQLINEGRLDEWGSKEEGILKGLIDSWEDYTSRLNSTQTKIDNISSSTDKMSSSAKIATNAIQEWANTLKSVQSVVDNTTKSIENLANTVSESIDDFVNGSYDSADAFIDAYSNLQEVAEDVNKAVADADAEYLNARKKASEAEEALREADTEEERAAAKEQMEFWDEVVSAAYQNLQKVRQIAQQIQEAIANAGVVAAKSAQTALENIFSTIEDGSSSSIESAIEDLNTWVKDWGKLSYYGEVGKILSQFEDRLEELRLKLREALSKEIFDSFNDSILNASINFGIFGDELAFAQNKLNALSSAVQEFIALQVRAANDENIEWTQDLQSQLDILVEDLKLAQEEYEKLASVEQIRGDLFSGITSGIESTLEEFFNLVQEFGSEEAWAQIQGKLEQNIKKNIIQTIIRSLAETALIKDQIQKLVDFIVSTIDDGLSTSDISIINRIISDINKSVEDILPYIDVITDAFGLAEGGVSSRTANQSRSAAALQQVDLSSLRASAATPAYAVPSLSLADTMGLNRAANDIQKSSNVYLSQIADNMASLRQATEKDAESKISPVSIGEIQLNIQSDSADPQEVADLAIRKLREELIFNRRAGV